MRFDSTLTQGGVISSLRKTDALESVFENGEDMPVKRYGLPYMGSKSKIAEDILSFLPPGSRFVDLFGGGGEYDALRYGD